MSLHSGLDTVGIISHGLFTKTYGASAPANIANLYVSLGFFEDAPNIVIRIINIVMSYFRRREAN